MMVKVQCQIQTKDFAVPNATGCVRLTLALHEKFIYL